MFVKPASISAGNGYWNQPAMIFGIINKVKYEMVFLF
jgi:hypothetical protein